MSLTYTQTQSSTFTIAHAREIASRVAADLRLCAAYYDKPSTEGIPDYLEELAILLRDGYVREYEFGFKRDGQRIPGACWRYTANAYGQLESDRPGKIAAYVDVSRATYYNFLTHSDKWHRLSVDEQSRIEATLPFQRSSGYLPSDGNGYWVSDKTYTAGGVGLARQSFISY